MSNVTIKQDLDRQIWWAPKPLKKPGATCLGVSLSQSGMLQVAIAIPGGHRWTTARSVLTEKEAASWIASCQPRAA